jgi:hypothetical protein
VETFFSVGPFSQKLLVGVKMSYVLENIYNADGSVETIYSQDSALELARRLLQTNTLEEVKIAAQEVLDSSQNQI